MKKLVVLVLVLGLLVLGAVTTTVFMSHEAEQPSLGFGDTGIVLFDDSSECCGGGAGGGL